MDCPLPTNNTHIIMSTKIASKHECPPLGKHSSSMLTVEVFAKPGCSREPRKIPNENPFSAEFRCI